VLPLRYFQSGDGLVAVLPITTEVRGYSYSVCL
jgi:hypothetical protein